MHDTALYPPNSQQLSDNVIGTVVVRHNKKKQADERALAIDPVEPGNGQLDSTARHGALASAPKEAERANKNRLTAEQVLARHRLVRRNIQRRYRKKLQDKAVDLETSVQQLQAEIRRLREARNQPQRSLIVMTPWKVMVEHCRLFRYGFKPPVSVPELCADTTSTSFDIAYVQARFCQSVMAQDVLCNAGYGVMAGLENQRLISLHHENLDVQLVCLESGPGHSVIAHQNAITTITATMLRQALPHLVAGDDEDGWDPVALKLIGQQVVIPGTAALGALHKLEVQDKLKGLRHHKDAEERVLEEIRAREREKQMMIYNAATRIQKVYRGLLCRREYAKMVAKNKKGGGKKGKKGKKK